MKLPNIHSSLRLALIALGLSLLSAGCADKELESRKLVRNGVAKLYKMQFEDAMQDFEKAAAFDPQNHEAWFYIGTVHQNYKDYHTAIEYFTKAIQIKEDYADAFYNRGLCWFYLGDRNRSCDDWLAAEGYGRKNLSDRTDKCR
jgi:tetratricopeptide (TPR) repeat protein